MKSSKDRQGYFLNTRGQRTNFHEVEARCHCGQCPFRDLSQFIVDWLDYVRDTVGLPVNITSAIRCPRHNRRVGGARMSRHLPDTDGVGHAVDIVCPRGPAPFGLYQIADQWTLGGGRGLYRGWLHLDDRADRMEWVGTPAEPFYVSGPDAVRDFATVAVHARLV